MASYFTVYGSNSVDQKIRNDLQYIKEQVLQEIPEKWLKGIVLGGGYGRGEGGVLLKNNQEVLFNDFDFFVFISNNLNSKKNNFIKKKLSYLHEKLSTEIGIHVDFSDPYPEAFISSTPFTLLWYELKFGYEIIFGNKNLLDQMPSFIGEEIHLYEAMKLLLNRGSGLILAREKLSNLKFNDTENLEFVIRNCMKAIMALGDSFLMQNHDYHFSYRERCERIKKYSSNSLIVKTKLLNKYIDAIEYKFKPEIEFNSMIDLQTFFEDTLELFSVFYYEISSTFFCEKIDNVDKYFEKFKNLHVDYSLKELIKNFIHNTIIDKFQNFSWNIYSKYPLYRLFLAFPYLIFEMKFDKHIAQALSVYRQEDVWEKYFFLWERFN